MLVGDLVKKVVFYLMNEKGYHMLQNYLLEFEADIIEYIVLSRDGNIINDYYEDIRSLCHENNIKYYNRIDQIPQFSGYKFAIGWRWIIEDECKLIVLHDSLLPKYRGFAPLVNMLINGEQQIGVTALFASSEYDKGNIIYQESINIDYPLKIHEAIKIISPLYFKIISKIMNDIVNSKEISDIRQEESKATYSLWRDDDDYYIDWSKESDFIKRHIDAVGYPYNGAKTLLKDKKVIIDDVSIYDDVYIENRSVGKVIFVVEGHPVVVCGRGLIKIERARYEDGESVIPLKSFRLKFGGKQ